MRSVHIAAHAAVRVSHRRDGVTGRQAVVVVRGLRQGDTT